MTGEKGVKGQTQSRQPGNPTADPASDDHVNKSQPRRRHARNEDPACRQKGNQVWESRAILRRQRGDTIDPIALCCSLGWINPLR